MSKVQHPDDIVGHKTVDTGERDEHGFPVYRHEPITRAEGEAIWAHAELCDRERKERMPDEKSAINALFDAWLRLKDFGWKEPMYCPKDGKHFHIIELGSTGIFEGAYSGEWPNGHWDSWDDHDSYCSSIAPAMFKLFPADAAAESERWKNAGAKLRAALADNPPSAPIMGEDGR